MWIASELGFFSVVVDRQQPGALLVRARSRQDLERLCLSGGFYAGNIRVTSHADYLYKMTLDRSEVVRVLSLLVQGLEYGNFKGHTAKTLGVHRADIYHDAWAAFLRIQTEPEVVPVPTSLWDGVADPELPIFGAPERARTTKPKRSGVYKKINEKALKAIKKPRKAKKSKRAS